LPPPFMTRPPSGPLLKPIDLRWRLSRRFRFASREESRIGLLFFFIKSVSVRVLARECDPYTVLIPRQLFWCAEFPLAQLDCTQWLYICATLALTRAVKGSLNQFLAAQRNEVHSI
jgi:hypothetical protein